jgi:signal transduction histidine kinase
MDRELAAHKIALQLSLEDKLPSVLGNRVQIQRVIINLLTNAIESIVAAGSQRRIVIRSTSLDELNVQLDVSDSGAGITPEEMGRIFEPFFTTKATGTGLGLSLSRTVIEEHGGRLWASAGEDFGATFHLQLKRRPEAT